MTKLLLYHDWVLDSKVTGDEKPNFPNFRSSGRSGSYFVSFVLVYLFTGGYFPSVETSLDRAPCTYRPKQEHRVEEGSKGSIASNIVPTSTYKHWLDHHCCRLLPIWKLSLSL